jgi:hypothetical protein
VAVLRTGFFIDISGLAAAFELRCESWTQEMRNAEEERKPGCGTKNCRANARSQNSTHLENEHIRSKEICLLGKDFDWASG